MDDRKQELLWLQIESWTVRWKFCEEQLVNHHKLRRGVLLFSQLRRHNCAQLLQTISSVINPRQ